MFNSYVDDCIRSFVDNSDVFTVIMGTADVFQKGGFNLTQFLVNDSELLERIPQEKRAAGVRDVTPFMEGKFLD